MAATDAPRPPLGDDAGRPGGAETGAPACDLSTTCLVCGAEMNAEHAHYRCPGCGWRDSCCDGPY